jgi:hypothetical protein
MSNLRHADNRLVEIDAALEQLRQIKEDTVKLIMSLQEAARDRETPKLRGPRGAQLWMASVGNEGAVINADE